MQWSQALALSVLLPSAAWCKTWSSEYDILEFDNVGFSGTYFHVADLGSTTSETCECQLSTEKTKFSGKQAPLDEELSVHIRGPLTLEKFGYYVSESYTIGSSSDNKDWTRLAYYDASSQTTDNVTFLTLAGDDSPCLGKALSYAGSDGTSYASESTVLAEDNLIHSAEMYSMYSTVACDSSSYDNDCGVYRDGIPAFHGFYGTTKMFLFEFEMPEETVEKNSTNKSYYDMPAIWLLNAHIARTSQFPGSTNCSCWTSGCGEFDIFEAMNTTSSNQLYSTIHDYHNTGDIGTGLQAYGWIERTPSHKMSGGVVFDSSGTARVFLNNDTSIDSNISASDLATWLTSDSIKVDDLKSSSSAMSLATGYPQILLISVAVVFTFLL